MRVLMTADTIGGVWTYTIDLVGVLARWGVEVHLVTFGQMPSATQLRESQQIRGLTLLPTKYRLEWMHEPWRDIDKAGALLRRLEEEIRPDVVHLNQFCYGALGWRTPTIAVGHSCVYTWWNAVYGTRPDHQWLYYWQRVQQGISRAHCFVTPSRAVMEMFAEAYGRHENECVIHNGRDNALFAPKPKRPFILGVGRVWDAAKNFTMLDAVANKLPWPTVLIGSDQGPGGQQMLPKHAAHRGPMGPGRLGQYMAKASIYALPAYYEPFGLSAVEAGNAGCALVLGDIPSLHEVWGDAAVYVNPASADEIEAKVQWLIEHPDNRHAYARAARGRAQQYAAERMASQYWQLYQELRGYQGETRCQHAREVA